MTRTRHTHDVEVILVGDELLKGERTDAHLSRIGSLLVPCGVRVGRAHVTGDSIEAIADLVRSRRANTRVLIVTGGLGPTGDDITRDGVAAGLGMELEFHGQSWAHIQSLFAARGAVASENNRQQAMFPVGSRVIHNPNGSAPGFEVSSGETTVFVLPGPPRELGPMFEGDVIPRIHDIFAREPLRVETFRTIGVGESVLVTEFGHVFDSIASYAISFLPSLVGVDVILTEKGDAPRAALELEADRVHSALRDGVASKYYERGQRTLTEVVHDLLVQRGETLAIAESLTGGMIGSMLVTYPGSSAYLLADVVTYSNESKRDMVGVHQDTLELHGAVSEETCTEMAHGVRRKTGATWSLATTGVAGPDGGTAKKPVGLCFVGVAWDGGSRVRRFHYRGSRDVVRERAAWAVLWLLYDRLLAA